MNMLSVRVYEIKEKQGIDISMRLYYDYQRTKLEDGTKLLNEANLILKDKNYFKAWYIKDSLNYNENEIQYALNHYWKWKHEDTKQIKYFKKILYWIYYRLPISKKLSLNIEFKLK